MDRPPGGHPCGPEGFRERPRRLARDTAIALPPEFELELVEARSQSWETFRAEIERADTAIAQNLTTEVKGGSYSAGRWKQLNHPAV